MHDSVGLVIALASGFTATFERADSLTTFLSSFLELKRVAAPITVPFKSWELKPIFVAALMECSAIPRAIRSVMTTPAHTTTAFIKGFVARLTVAQDRHNESFRLNHL